MLSQARDKKLIYVVEDDLALQELYAFSLEAEFACQCFEGGQGLFTALAKMLPDLILLDVMLTDIDGFEILRQLKAQGSTSQIPVIMVSAKGEELSKVKGLNLGANDYISKPFGVLELIARIKANLRHVLSTNVFTYKDIEINLDAYGVTINNQTVSFSLKEYNLLKLLVEHANAVVSREKIFESVWQSNYIGETRTLDMHIKALRQKLSEAGSTVTIQTTRGVGYMLL